MDFKYYRWSLLHIIGLALLLGGLAIALWLDYRTLAFVLCGLLALAFAALIRLYHHVFESIDLMFKALINDAISTNNSMPTAGTSAAKDRHSMNTTCSTGWSWNTSAREWWSWTNRGRCCKPTRWHCDCWNCTLCTTSPR